jgi:hypothetical protein
MQLLLNQLDKLRICHVIFSELFSGLIDSIDDKSFGIALYFRRLTKVALAWSTGINTTSLILT